MKQEIPCLVYSADADLGRRLTGFLGSRTTLRSVTDAAALRQGVEQTCGVLALVDLRMPDSVTLLSEIAKASPTSLTIALGLPRSEPALLAEALGVYAVEDLDGNGRKLQALVGRALQQIELLEEVRILRKRVAHSSALHEAMPLPGSLQNAPMPLRLSFPPLRNFGNVEALLQGIIGGITNAAVVLRAGVFSCVGSQSVFELKADLGCRDETRRLAFASNHPLVRWMEAHAHMVSRAGLHHVTDVAERVLLERSLDSMGAELIVPLHGRRQLIGWLFLGRRATGAPFDTADFQDITVFAEHISTALENALLYREITLQKQFAEILLHSIPTGIVAVGEDGKVHWFNDAAERILSVSRSNVIHQPVETMGGRIADLLRRELRGETPLPMPQTWVEPVMKRYLSMQTARLIEDSACRGAVAFVHDLSQERLFKKRQQELERAAFWTELAASMSHEVRNPLVAIKTFAQLLPERYADPEFREGFSSLMSQEVDRLNTIIEQINRFAYLPRPEVAPLDIGRAVRSAVELARNRISLTGIHLELAIPPGLPPMKGDEHALADCFAHLIVNAAEALAGKKDGHIVVSARPIAHATAVPTVEIVVRDNGGGIPVEILDKAFSPFCSTKKTGGMGLGLAIAQRTVTDHDGEIHIDSGAKGTSVTVLIPVTDPHLETPT